MKLPIVLFLFLLLSGCYVPNTFSFNLPVTNKTEMTSIHCDNWNKIGDKIVKSTCYFDNRNNAEKHPVEIRAYDKQGFMIGSAFIGKATIGEKVKINKAMEMSRIEEPALLTLEVVN